MSLEDKIKEIIDSGRETDYYYNGEDEVSVETFDTNYVAEKLVDFINKETFKLYSK